MHPIMHPWSHPIRDAWIEMPCVSVVGGIDWSHPIRDAWIEMQLSLTLCY